jgi:pimeloyl-ACP methyl ester carboxylesterase
MTKFVLIHAAWHSGAELEPVAALMRSMGHEVHTPTLRGNAPGDAKTVGLSDAIDSIVEYLERTESEDIVLVGHSYGGMVISGVADRVPHRIRRLVYWSAYVPKDGESVLDMSLPHQVGAMEALAAKRGDGAVVLPFELWREAFINDGDLETAERAYNTLNPHPMQTFRDKISLSAEIAEMALPKSYINCTEDIVLVNTLEQLSERLGLFRLVQIPGSHEISFTRPDRIAKAVVEAGRD